ncbi:MAG: L,D-transpeptidase [Rhizobiales bacterium]|nr:L,D-transpeptidase [Hyphomicrobiales bacterium]
MKRRLFLAGAASALLASPALARKDLNEAEWVTGIIPEKPFDIQLMNLERIPPAFRRQDVRWNGREEAGSVVVDVAARHLYVIGGQGKAIRFGIAVGREGVGWSGTTVVGRKARWPTWTPTAGMRQRNPKLPVQVKGGPENPLGARALYLYRDGRDTLYRIHGTNEPWSIGKAASSGCFRMLNEDVFELYGSVPVGARVFVR